MNKERLIGLITAHKYLSSLGVFLLLFLLLLISFFFQRIKQQKELAGRTVLEVADITPTITHEELSILTISPKNGTQDVRSSEKIAITFSRPLSPFEKSGIVFEAKPAIDALKEWSDNHNILIITPKSPLLYSQTYNLEARYDDQRFAWTFTTASIGAVFSDTTPTPTFMQRNPLEESLPHQTADYTVFYDKNKQELVATLFPKTASSTPITQQEERMKKEILLYLESNKIDVKVYPIRYVSKPG